MKEYKITAICPNETVADDFIRWWVNKGYECYKMQQAQYCNDGLRMGAWSVYKSKNSDSYDS